MLLPHSGEVIWYLIVYRIILISSFVITLVTRDDTSINLSTFGERWDVVKGGTFEEEMTFTPEADTRRGDRTKEEGPETGVAVSVLGARFSPRFLTQSIPHLLDYPNKKDSKDKNHHRSAIHTVYIYSLSHP